MPRHGIALMKPPECSPRLKNPMALALEAQSPKFKNQRSKQEAQNAFLIRNVKRETHNPKPGANNSRK